MKNQKIAEMISPGWDELRRLVNPLEAPMGPWVQSHRHWVSTWPSSAYADGPITGPPIMNRIVNAIEYGLSQP